MCSSDLLAYSVYGVWNSRYDYPGLFIAGGQTRTDATVPFIKAILGEIDRLRNQPVTAKELEDAKGNKEQIAAIEKKYFERNKKLQIAQATMATAQSAVQAFNSLAGIPIVGPALGTIAAAAAITAGALQIQKIKNTTFDGDGSLTTNEIGRAHV